MTKKIFVFVILIVCFFIISCSSGPERHRTALDSSLIDEIIYQSEPNSTGIDDVIIGYSKDQEHILYIFHITSENTIKKIVYIDTKNLITGKIF